MIDAFASEPHFAEHIAAIWAELPPQDRGLFMTQGPHTAAVTASHTIPPSTRQRGIRPVLVASSGDMAAMHKDGRPVAIMEHGAGQSYGGRRSSSGLPSYAGGNHRPASLFLHPNSHAADRDRAVYPEARIEVVGSPILDTLPERDASPGPVIAFGFHFEATIAPETRPAFVWIREELRRLAAAGTYQLLGHGHPRIIERLAPWYTRVGIEVVRDFREVCRRADLFVADNTSALFAFAATDRPVVVLNPPWYDRQVHHGLRFWEAAEVGVNVDAVAELGPAIERALADLPDDRDLRHLALSQVYAYRFGAAARAARILLDWSQGAAA